jgi:Uma2 family endonuclease
VTEDSTFAPDVAVILKSRLPELPDDGFAPLPRDFAIEVVSPSDLKTPKRIRDKIAEYERAKLPLVWWVYPARQEIDVYEYGVKVRTAGISDTLDGGDVLPGFTLTVAKIFA